MTGYVNPATIPVTNWNTNPLTNNLLNIGCSRTCLIERNFICPANNTFLNRAGTLDLLCSDRCQDGEYDGPYLAVLRKTD